MPIKTIKNNRFFPWCLQNKFIAGNVWKLAISKDLYIMCAKLSAFNIRNLGKSNACSRKEILPTPYVQDTLIFKVLFAMLYSFQWTGNISWVIFQNFAYFLVVGLHHLKIIEKKDNSKICHSYNRKNDLPPKLFVGSLLCSLP